MLKLLTLLVIYITLVPSDVEGHGMVLEPVNRISRWRFNESAPIDFDDNGNFCGGYGAQWYANHGKCGLCGDDYAAPMPRRSELGGSIYGEGVIVKNYTKGGDLRVEVLITANHLGYFTFKICNLDKFEHESEECFDEVELHLLNGKNAFTINDSVGSFFVTLQLPEDLVCEHCVLQWTWRTGNSWGNCDNGSVHQGCGAQEHFRTCSDISITP